MNPNTTPEIALCPRCFCPLTIGQSYPVNLCLPAQLPPSTFHPNHPPASGTAVHPAHPAHQQNNVPAPTPAPEPSPNTQPLVREEEHTTRDERRNSTSSSSSFDSVFSDLPNDAEFAASLRAIDDRTLFTTCAYVFPPTEFSLTLSAIPSSSPSTESSLTLSGSDELSSTTRRWVVFRGRVPGVYASSTDATSQTDGFPFGLMLAFDDPAVANRAYEEFQEDGTTPDHGRGPWVVFIGRTPGVFTSYKELLGSVIGFSNNSYRCCESIEEGRQALDAFMANRTTVSRPMLLKCNRGSTEFTNDSWWCCVAGAEPGVYCGFERLMQASPVPGGTHRVESNEDGWELWSIYLAAGEVHVVPRAK